MKIQQKLTFTSIGIAAVILVALTIVILSTFAGTLRDDMKNQITMQRETVASQLLCDWLYQVVP